MLGKIYTDFYHKHPLLINLHVLITIFILPLEIIVFSVFTKRIFEHLHNKKFTVFLKILVIFIILLFIIQLLYTTREYIDSKIIPKFDTNTRNILFELIIKNYQNNKKSSTAEELLNIHKISSILYHNYENFINFLLPFFIGFIIFSCYLFWIKIQIGIMGFLFSSVYLLLFIVWFVRLSENSSWRRKKETSLFDVIEDILTNQENIYISKTENIEYEHIKLKNKELEDIKNKEMYELTIFKFIFIVLLCFFFIFLFLYSYTLFQEKSIPIWKLISFLAILILFCKTSISFLSVTPKAIHHFGSLSHVREYINNDHFSSSSFKKNDNQKTLGLSLVENKKDKKQYTIIFHDVSFQYPSAKSPILQNISLTIPYLSQVLIYGKIGTGKSTIAKLIMKMISPTHGKITIGGVDLHDWKQVPVSYMNQNNILFHRSMFENIFYGVAKLNESKDGSILTYQQKKDLSIFQKKFSFLYDLSKNVGRYGNNLSGGQRRIIFLLRCFFQDSPIMILDEPTANLDETSIEGVLFIIKHMKNKKTLICISHDPILISTFQTRYEI